MNYKPGDMARIVAPAPTHTVGHIVEVLGVATPEDAASVVRYDWRYAGEFLWVCKTVAGIRGVNQSGQRAYFMPGEEAFIPDAWLRPIRPGDDAVDEALQRLPAPERDEVAV